MPAYEPEQRTDVDNREQPRSDAQPAMRKQSCTEPQVATCQDAQPAPHQKAQQAPLAAQQEILNQPERQQTEIREAIEVADEALTQLREADDKLDDARHWSFADMLGLDFIGGFMKHRRMSDARKAINAAREAVRRFARELADVSGVGQIAVNMGDFLTFADFFFDNFVVDIIAHQRIEEARTQVREAITRIEGMRRDLQQVAATKE